MAVTRRVASLAGRPRTCHIAYAGHACACVRVHTDTASARAHTHTHTHTQGLDQDSNNINAADDAGRTALHWAAANGHDKIVKLLGLSPAPQKNIELQYVN